MSNLKLLILALVFLSCSKPKPEIPISNNEELKEMYEADQGDRKSRPIDWSVVSIRDEQRRNRVYELLDANLVRTSDDFANAAMIFQHGSDTIASSMAVKLMRKAVELDTSRDKWLLAAAIDRDLMRRGEPQIYGTQYVKNGPGEPWKLYEIDTTQVTDSERKRHGVKTLKELRERVNQMNNKTN